MKNFAYILVIITALVFLACGAANESDSVVADSGNADQSVGNGSDVEIEVEEALPLYPEGTLDPTMVTANEPVFAVALYNAFFAWEGKTVTLQGYPFVYYGDSTTIEDKVDLVVAFENREKLAEFTFDEPLNLTIPSNELLTVSGVIEYDSFGHLELVDGQIVSDPLPVVSIEEVSPYVYDGIAPIEVSDFHQLFNVWLDKEVTVNGYYSSTTTSTLSSGVIVRVDLSDPETRSKCVACEMMGELSEEVSDAMAENRENILIHGTIEGESFNIVGLIDCELVTQ